MTKESRPAVYAVFAREGKRQMSRRCDGGGCSAAGEIDEPFAMANEALETVAARGVLAWAAP